ncbi:glycosyl hydrolase [Deinococcus cellulosilyticus]|uniref:GH26 domain-containing protein n=1 Tax=Deinococcus cellulosilyticus (strain DSM 18568 / NBRC 106333 / KACC 11606 / 5516J-15) TaxID=1223518 RepID=A0A511MZ01_DEIC1|nr:glycosyl hydrolase [Deinococcus cellulosilyticus]GEM45561.1 hypothetical protein DC3_11960 [Deinococcus cellulosilyticus NBRC 106333 = KACC 11606]
MKPLMRPSLNLTGLLALLALSACNTLTPPKAAVNLVDPQADERTRSLFDYLQSVRGKEVIFGHQHATTEGMTLTAQDGSQSEVKNSVGDFPGMFGWDTLSLEGFEKPGVSGNKTQSRDNLIEVMKKAYKAGGVLALSAHMPNFVTGGSFYDTKGNVVSHILPGGSKHTEYNQFLDMIADFALNLKDDSGKPIPVIFRPFHEQNGGWFWWGAPYRTADQYKAIYRYTVEYLRDVKGVHNFLFAYSPNVPFNQSEATYLETYPGDEYVDILGLDAYYDGKSPAWYSGTAQDAKLVSRIADQRGKVAALTEFGYSNLRPTGTQDLNFFTKLLAALQADRDASRMAYMLTWANFGTSNFFVPYKNAAGLGDHDLLMDFTEFHKDPATAFSKEVTAANVYGRSVQTAPEKPLLHIATPNAQDILSSKTQTTLRVKVLHVGVSKVTYRIGNDPTEFEMALDPSTPMKYYTAEWQPDAALDETGTTLTVKVYPTRGAPLETSIPVYVGDSAGETDPLIVDTFDRYKGSNALLDTAYSPAGDPSTITLNETRKGSGKYGLQFAYTLGSQGYTGQVKNLGGVNWSSASKLRLWLQPDGSNNKLVLQVNASGIAFEAYPSLASAAAGWLDLPFSSFKVAPWDTSNAGKTLSADLLKDIRNFGIYVNKAEVGGGNTGTVYLDEIQAQP